MTPELTVYRIMDGRGFEEACPASVTRLLAAVGEASEVPRRSPGRGPPYWNSRVLRRQALGEEDDAQGGWVQEAG